MNVKINGFNQNGGTKDLSQIRISLDQIKKFLYLVQQLEKLPNIKRTSYDAARSLYHSVSTGHSIETLSKQMEMFFGPPKKSAGTPMPIKMKFNPSVRYLRGIRHEQVFFIKKTKTGFYYGALWPWQRIKDNITIHLGYCNNKMSDKELDNLEKMVKSRVLNEGVFSEFEADDGSRIHGISLASFLHMAMLEKLSCTIELKTDEVTGHLYLIDGELVDANTGSMKNKAAAYEILSWEGTEIEIKASEDKKKNTINEPLMEVLIEALRLRKHRRDKQIGPSDMARQRVSNGDTTYGRYQDLLDSAQKGRKKTRLLPVAAALIGLLILTGGGISVWKGMVKSSNAEKRYQSVLAKIENEENLDEKKKLLTQYLESSEESGFIQNARDKMLEIEKKIEEQDYALVISRVEELRVDKNYSRNAKEIYMTYLKKYPEGIHAGEIEDKILEISDRVAEHDFDQIKRSEALSYNVRIRSYMSYLAKHPTGEHRETVENMIQNLEREFYAYLNEQVPLCDKKNNWERCILLCDYYLSNFKNTNRMDEVAELKTKLIDKQEAQVLYAKVNKLGNDYKRAKSVYREFLDAHPDSYEYKKIKSRLDLINKKLSEKERWESLVALVENSDYSLREKINELSWYIRDNKAGRYVDDAKLMLSNLKNESRNLIRTQKKREKNLRAQAIRKEKNRIRREREKTIKDLNRAGDRYKINGNDTITDTKTGLTWCLLDSSVMLKSCQDYNSAVNYVKNLKTGGYSDWRLPRGSELAGIYKNPPFFPEGNAKWYWTAESYAKGYHNKVLIVTARNERFFEREERLASNCGAVRAVRP